MRIGLVSYRCKNRDVSFGAARIERAFKAACGRADALCFGEAFLQGFDSLCWDRNIDLKIAVSRDSETMKGLCALTEKYGMALITGYIERDGEDVYSSCAVIEKGSIVRNYRRISRGWKEIGKTDEHYLEGKDTEEFELLGTKIRLGLCGDLWDHPERFKTDGLLIWPVFCSYSEEEWENGILSEYVAHAAEISDETLMVNPIDPETGTVGGAFWFKDGRAAARTQFGREQILIVDTVSGETEMIPSNPAQNVI